MVSLPLSLLLPEESGAKREKRAGEGGRIAAAQLSLQRLYLSLIIGSLLSSVFFYLCQP